MLALPFVTSQACSALIAAGAVPATVPDAAGPRRLQVPLADRRPTARRRDRARHVERIVRHGDDVLLLVGDRVFDVALGADPRRELRRDVMPLANTTCDRSEIRPARRQGDADALAERQRLHHVLAERRLGLHAQHRRAGAELDDHPRRQGRCARARHLRQRCVQRERREQRRGDDSSADQDSSHHSLLQRAALTTPPMRRARRAGVARIGMEVIESV